MLGVISNSVGVALLFVDRRLKEIGDKLDSLSSNKNLSQPK